MAGVATEEARAAASTASETRLIMGEANTVTFNVPREKHSSINFDEKAVVVVLIRLNSR